MQRSKAPLLLFFLFLFNAQAAWVEKESGSAPSDVAGVTHQHTALENPGTGARAALDLAIFSPKFCRLLLIDNRDGTRRLAEIMSRPSYAAGANGGYFDTGFAPLGLRIQNSRMVAPLVRAKLLSGVLAVWPNRITIFRAREFSKKLKPAMAIQSGPFLVDQGLRVKELEATREARRTFVAVATGNRAAIGTSSEISLADLAEILAGSPGNFRVERALNLDGGSSSAFWFRQKQGNALSISEQKPVRDFLVIEAK